MKASILSDKRRVWYTPCFSQADGYYWCHDIHATTKRYGQLYSHWVQGILHHPMSFYYQLQCFPLQLKSPIIPTKPQSIPEMMKPVCIPNKNISANNSGYVFNKTMAIVTYTNFLIIRMGEAGHELISPNATASFSLWPHNICSFSSSSTSRSTMFVSSKYPASFICPAKLSKVPYIFSFSGCDVPPTRNACTLLLISIQLPAGLLFNHLSSIFLLNFATSHTVQLRHRY